MEVNNNNNLKNILDKIEFKNKQLEEVNKTKSLEDRKTLGKDDFLKMMMASLKYQDPTSPVNPDDFSNKMTQFSSLEQLINLNKNFNSFVENSKNDSNLNYNLLGKKVEIDDSKININNRIVSPIEIQNQKNIANAQIQVFNEFSEPVKTLNIELNPGKNKITWDGKDDLNQMVPDGKYTYKITSQDENGNKNEISTQKTLEINGIDLSDKKNIAFLSDGKIIKQSDIKKIFNE